MAPEKLAALWPYHRVATSPATRTFLSCLVATCLISLYVASAIDVSEAHDLGRAIASGAETPRLQARISLESKSFDLAEEESDKNDELKEQAHNDFSSTSSTAKPRAKEKRKSAEKSSRRLSNIWSMFLPSSESADYENGESAADEDSESGALEERPTSAAPSPLTVNKTISANQELADERMVAKLNRPAALGDSTLVAPSNASSTDKREQDQRSSANSTGDDSPVRLVTGSLTSGDVGGQPNINEIVSNIMRSLNSTAPSASKTVHESENSSADSEAEVLDKGTANIGSLASNKNSSVPSDNSQFERWLSRIKMQQAVAGGRFREPTTSSTTVAPSSQLRYPSTNEPGQALKASAAWHLRTSSNEMGSKSSKQQVALRTPPTEQMSHSNKQLIRDVGNKGLPRRANSATQPQQQHVDVHHRLKYQSHPFQQQMRQLQTQLIHGIKSPAGQASTISVSTTEGASNTSLAFGSHYIPQLNPINSNQQPPEMSQVVNSTNPPHQLANHNTASESSSTSNNNGDHQNVEQQNIYQSQDEILRQVTSAINFEQQQLNMISQKKEEAANGRPTGPPSGDDNFMTPDGASRLLASASGPANSSNESGTSVSASPLETMLKATGNSTSRIDPLDVDKSFHSLAERVRQLAAQQEKLQREQQQLLANASSGAGQEPSWLRASLVQQALGGRDEFGSLISGLKLDQQNKTLNQQPNSLDQIRELLQRREKTKGELKSSQESMMELMRQMIQLKATGGQRPDQMGNESVPLPPEWTHDKGAHLAQSPTTNLMAEQYNPVKQNDGPHGEQMARAPAGASNVGWMPTNGQVVVRQQHQPLPSPGQQVRGRLRFPNQAPQSQLMKQQPLPAPPNNVGLMLAPQLDQIDGNELMDQRIIGLPIALMNNNDELELSHGQLEEAARLAAEQLGVQSHVHAGAVPHEQHHLQRAAAMNKKALQFGANESLRQSIGNSKFVPRVAPNQVVQSQQQQQQQQQQQEQLMQVQRLLQASSAQTFPPHNGRQSEGDLPQHQQNFLQIEKLVSLLPAEHRAQLAPAGSGASLHLERHQLNNSSHLESIANLLSSRPETVELLAGFNQNRPNKEESRHNDQRQQTNRPEADDKSRDEAARSPPSSTQDARIANVPVRQEQQAQQQIEPSVVSNVPQMIGHYGQLPRPASGSLMHEFRPMLGPRAYPPTRAMHVAADEGPTPLVTTTSMMNAGGPPTKLREISFYRPFGFRGHHALTYQASPTVAAIFPRFIAQPPGSQPPHHSMLDPNGRLIQTAAARPGILRHMTPIRATINEGQRLISQMLTPQLADHLAHYHRYYHHQYPSHTNMGTLPIPPVRQHHLMSLPMRRSHSAGRLSRTPPDSWVRSRTREEIATNLPASSRMRSRHIPAADVQSLEYNVANEDNQLIQVGDELVFASPEHSGEEALGVELVEQQLHPQMQMHLETDQQLGEHAKRSRPSRQMLLSPVERQRLNHSIDRVARLQIDRPSVMAPLTQPCIPFGINQNASSSSTTTTTSTTTASPTITTQTSSTSTSTPISTLETNRDSPATDTPKAR